MAAQLYSYAPGFLHGFGSRDTTRLNQEQKNALIQALLFVFAIQTPVWAALYWLVNTVR